MSEEKTKTIIVSVLPRSSRNELVSEVVAQNCNFIKVKLTAAPVKGQANDELIKFLAKKYNVSKSRVEIVKGLTNKEKLVKIYLP